MKFLKNIKFGKSLKFVLPGIIVVVLIAIILGRLLVPNKAMGSVYSIEQVSQDIDSIRVGDTINYEINGYDDWQVLYVDKENGTVDLVSGGIVKNVMISGDTGYNNYSEILQDEVNAYKNGPNVVGVRALAKSDLSNLNLIKDEVNAKYWLNSKKSVRKILESNYYAQFYSVLTSSYNGDEIESEYIYLFIYYTGVDSGVNNYTAGIRPVVTMKVDALKKLSDEEVKKIEKSSVIADKPFANEQTNNNKNYSAVNKNITNSASSAGSYGHDEAIRNDDKVDPNLTTVTGNSSYDNSTSIDSTFDSGLFRGYLRFIDIGIILLIITGIIIAILLGLIYRKIDNLRR